VSAPRHDPRVAFDALGAKPSRDICERGWVGPSAVRRQPSCNSGRGVARARRLCSVILGRGTASVVKENIQAWSAARCLLLRSITKEGPHVPGLAALRPAFISPTCGSARQLVRGDKNEAQNSMFWVPARCLMVIPLSLPVPASARNSREARRVGRTYLRISREGS
jgi:hypothetical protein